MDTQTPAGADTGTPGPTPGTGPGPHPGTTPPAPNAFWAGVRRTGLHRSDERWVGGVAGGLAERIGVDPLIVRGVLAVSFLLGGLGLVLYGAAWALLPDARDDRILLERLGAGDADGALLGSLAFVVVGFARGDGWWWFWDGSGPIAGLLWLVFVVALVVVVVTAVQRRGRTGPPPWQHGGPHTGPHAGPYAGPHGPGHGTPTWGTGPSGAATASASAPAPATGPVPPAPAWGAPTAPLPPAGPGGPGTPPPPYGSAPVPPVPPTPPVPPRPPRRGADGATVGAVVGLSVVGLGVLMLLDRAGLFAGPVWLTAGGITLVVAGLGIVTLALRGRTSGFVGFVAVVAALVWVPAALVHQTDWDRALPDWREGRAQDVTVTSRADAESGFQLGVGSSRIDLTGVPLDGRTLRVPVSIGAGELVVVVPTEAAVEATVSAGAGTVRWELDGRREEQSGLGLDAVTFQDEDAAAGRADIVLDIESGVGEVRIIEEDAA